MTTSSNPDKQFNLLTVGLGYLNRIRDVRPAKGKKGDPFLACDIAALKGPSDNVSYERFDTRVTGSEAKHLVRRCIEAVEAKKKVLIGFCLGDLTGTIFTYTKGEKAGQPGLSQKTHLVRIYWIKVDGVLVYKSEKKPSDDTQETPVPAVADSVGAQETPVAESSESIADPVDGAPAEASTLAAGDSF